MSVTRRLPRSWLAIGVVAFFALALPQVAAAEINWVVQATTNPPPEINNALDDVSCPSLTECIAVGHKASGAPLAERWNGSAWSTTSNPGGEQPLTDVSCSANGFCIAVPSSGTNAQRWNGSAWSSVPIVAPAESTSLNLSDVSCTSSTACMAVGSYAVNGGGGFKTLAERWNGTGWSITSTPNGETATANTLASVYCFSEKSCTAVGKINTKTPLAVSWNGTEWTTMPAPKNIAGTTAADLACYGSNICFFSQGNTSATLNRWNGTEWTAVTLPTPEGGSNPIPSGLSCASGSCFAVGSYQKGEKYLSLVEKWSGTSWSVETTPTPEPGAVLSGVSCRSSSHCTTVGINRLSGSESKTLALEYAASPVALTTSATAVSASEATVGAWVFLEDSSTYQFEYGTTTSYGSSLPIPPGEAGPNNEEISLRLEGLTPNTTYHYRVVVSNPHGTSKGEDRTFKTSESGLAQHWYANWSKLAEKTPTGLVSKATSNFVLKWTNSAINFEISCSALATPETTVENPALGAAGVGKGLFKLSGCTVLKPSKCIVSSGTINMSSAIQATEFEKRPAVRFIGSFVVGMENCVSKTVPFEGNFYGTLHGSNSTLEFTEAGSFLTTTGNHATLTGAAKIETASGQSLALLP
jgi:hypothetical protein